MITSYNRHLITNYDRHLINIYDRQLQSIDADIDCHLPHSYMTCTTWNLLRQLLDNPYVPIGACWVGCAGSVRRQVAMG